MMTIRNTGKRTVISIAITLLISILIKIASLNPDWIERHYSQGLYRYISSFYRVIFGWLPISVGDILYAAAGIYLSIKTIKFVKVLSTRHFRHINYKRVATKGFFILAAVYIYFNLTWGLNYNRPGIASQLQLNPETHNLQDLKMITDLLLSKVNENRLALGNNELHYKPYAEIFTDAKHAYERSATTFPFLHYEALSVKKSLYGRVGNFLGFLGYYNPFTGEAQLNLTQPRFLIPYVSCHEMAHQLGYASESEASFVGYLAATQSGNTMFQYSAFFDLFNYANKELYLRDSAVARNNYNKLDTLVKKDFAELREYWRKSENPVEPIIKIFYDHYLKANQQSKGLQSYNEVIGWLIAYYKAFGKI